MPEAFQRYWDAHPERWHQRNSGRPRYKFPKKGTPQQQAIWFRDEFLKLADKIKEPRERAALLAHAFRATMQGAKAPDRASGNEDEQYREHLAKMVENQEAREARNGRRNADN